MASGPTVTPDISFRPTATADLDAVTAWERHPDTVAYVVVWPRDRHLIALRHPTMRQLIVACGGRSVGFVILAGVDGPRPVVELRRIVIAEKGRGIGQAAVALVTRYAFDELDAAEVWLDVAAYNSRAAHVYAKCGFRIDSTADLWGEIAGRRTRLVKMTLSRERVRDGGIGGEAHYRRLTHLT